VIRATYSPANEMLTQGRITYRYDHLGNQVEKTGPGSWHQVFGYSVAVRLVSFSKGHDHERLDIHRDRDKGCGHERWLKEVLYNPDNERVPGRTGEALPNDIGSDSPKQGGSTPKRGAVSGRCNGVRGFGRGAWGPDCAVVDARVEA